MWENLGRQTISLAATFKTDWQALGREAYRKSIAIVNSKTDKCMDYWSHSGRGDRSLNGPETPELKERGTCEVRNLFREAKKVRTCSMMASCTQAENANWGSFQQEAKGHVCGVVGIPNQMSWVLIELRFQVHLKTSIGVGIITLNMASKNELSRSRTMNLILHVISKEVTQSELWVHNWPLLKGCQIWGLSVAKTM